jgi:hypothetical protein
MSLANDMVAEKSVSSPRALSISKAKHTYGQVSCRVN